MSLATRCTSCGTVFRVVQDQLKVSEGWVRCGRCEQVFNALEGLFDLERDTPPGVAAAQFEDLPLDGQRDERRDLRERDDSDSAQRGQTNPHGPMPAARQGRDDDGDELGDPNLVERLDAHLFGTRTRRAESGTTPSAHVDKRDRHEFSDAQFDPNLVVDEDEEPLVPGLTDAPAGNPPPLESETAAAKAATVADPGAPEFLRQAQQRARWQQPRVRFALGAAFGLLALALALQTAHHFRDVVAARWPSSKPLLLAWCDVAGCSIATPKRIDDIVVDSTALGRLGTDAFQLSVTLRNRGQIDVALPDIDLTLTDVAGQLLARRVLAPHDFRATLAALPPGGEVALQAPIAAGPLPVSGYTVEVFYP